MEKYLLESNFCFPCSFFPLRSQQNENCEMMNGRNGISEGDGSSKMEFI